MLRADAEMRCLSRDVVPMLREVEDRDRLHDDELGAAISYLEVLWIEARRRADATEAAFAEATTALCDGAAADDELCSKASRFHDAVATLRATVTRRISPLLVASDGGTDAHDAPVAGVEPQGSPGGFEVTGAPDASAAAGI